ncbi:MAG: hypothetical protein J6D08_01900 [Lachnospiraceae bacterium]|nr:hypothetical protein [Lachnospiraceae bacterium]
MNIGFWCCIVLVPCFMLAGALVSYFITSYAALIAFIVWGILFFKDVHIDAHKAFEKYLLK